ncbi:MULTISPECIES: SPOR domain-containing protein [unclassified Microbacterium]|uniref:SPOR domain-containing protein n=1 Tax=unclassified Microbacterium TaxID=2609290 RepID=UPI003745FD19
MTEDDPKYWYNLNTGQVEHGLVSPMANRAGPFDTAEEAANAPALMRERNREWDDEDKREKNWGADGAQS